MFGYGSVQQNFEVRMFLVSGILKFALLGMHWNNS